MVPNYHRPTNLQDRSETQEEIITEAYCLILSTSMPEQPNYNQDCLVSLMNSETPIWKSSLITIVAQPHFVNQIKPWPSIYAWYANCADTLFSISYPRKESQPKRLNSFEWHWQGTMWRLKPRARQSNKEQHNLIWSLDTCTSVWKTNNGYKFVFGVAHACWETHTHKHTDTHTQTILTILLQVNKCTNWLHSQCLKCSSQLFFNRLMLPTSIKNL